MRSRVMPGSSPTMERREPVSRLKRVDLPTFGRPTMAKTGASPFAAFDIVLRVVRFLAFKSFSWVTRSRRRTLVYYRNQIFAGISPHVFYSSNCAFSALALRLFCAGGRVVAFEPAL